MTSFLLIISFLLHILLFIIIFYLYQHIQTLKSSQATEIDQMLNDFIKQIKLENQALQKSLSHPTEKGIKNDDGQNKELENEQMLDKVAKKELFDHLQINTDQLVTKPTDQVETSLQSKVIYLHDQGHSIENIAKKLNCGKTEVELLIKFNQSK